VLQPNYRGSTGYAPEISRDHRYDFRRMHDDVTDATKAILHSGLVDPRRVAIMGGSFGGYLALTGVAFEDSLYRCAISVCGVFDWEAFIDGKRYGALPGEYEELRDNLGSDRQRFEQISPLAHVEQIRVPILLAHGSEDPVVDMAQSQKLAAALKKRGVPYETFFRSGEGHGFYEYTNRVEFYHRVEAFLAANLGDPSLIPGKSEK
jgi:dipeptidyl aminopeptidase/acylaminoacyl peptidase